MELSSSTELSELGLTERELFSIYVQYPDIDFDPECALNTTDSKPSSSPASNLADHDKTDSTYWSYSTAQTTPLRHPLFITSMAPLGEYPELIGRLRTCDLPHATAQEFKSLASQIIRLGRQLLTANGSPRIHVEGKMTIRQSNSLVQQFQRLSSKCNDQLANLAYIKDLAPFTVVPTDLDLWSNYQQRAMLIIRYTAPPCRTERTLITRLTHVFDAYVYHPFLKLCRLGQLDDEIQIALNGVYDSLMTWQGAYLRWWRAMKDLRIKYMTPVMRRIQASPVVLQDIERIEDNLVVAKSLVLPLLDLGPEVDAGKSAHISPYPATTGPHSSGGSIPSHAHSGVAYRGHQSCNR